MYQYFNERNHLFSCAAVTASSLNIFLEIAGFVVRIALNRVLIPPARFSLVTYLPTGLSSACLSSLKKYQDIEYLVFY